MEQIENLLKPRYKVIADWPGVAGKVCIGDVLVLDDLNNANVFWCDGKAFTEGKLQDYPHLFQKLEWWQHRTIEELQSVKYVKVIIYRGYWRVGDIVPVESFEIGSIEKAKPTGYILKYRHYQPVFELLPSTEQEYLS